MVLYLIFSSLSQMKNINTVLGFLFVFSFLPLFSSAQLASNTTEINQKVDELLKKMTLEEKVGQMNQYNGFWEITGPAPKDGNAKLKYEHLKRGLVGSVLNVKGVENVRKIQEIVVNESRLGIPLLLALMLSMAIKLCSPFHLPNQRVGI